MEKKIIIAIDGFSSCGKSTMAKALAKQLNYIYIDSGAMYRAITLYALRHSLINNGVVDIPQLVAALSNITLAFVRNAEGKSEMALCGEVVERDIRTLEVSNNVSPVSAIREVRQFVDAQLRILGKDKGIVMDGRDIGTTVFPNAELKIYVTADAKVRAERRYLEMTQKGEVVNFDDVLANVIKRDEIDKSRKESPLRKADDAIELNNTHLTPEEQMAWLLDVFNKRIASL